VTDMSLEPPDVVMLPSANRVLPLRSLVTVTRVWSAVLNDSARSVNRRASSRDSTGDVPEVAAACITRSEPY
jgi:hypothetical protein